MKFYPSALSIILGIVSSTTTNAFLHSPPRTSTLSIRHKRNQQQNKRTLFSDSSADEEAKTLISQLAFYPSDEPLSERIKNVQAEFDNVRSSGIGKFLSDELEAAEKIIQGHAASAESTANDVITKSEEDSEGSGDYLFREGFQAMSDVGKTLAREIWEVRQEFDELKAAKSVEEAVEDVVGADVLVEKNLEKAVQSVVSSLEEADEVVQSAIATVKSKEGLTDSDKMDLTEKLEAKAQSIEESIKMADSVAKTAKQIALDDEKVMEQLEKTGDRLSAAIDATESLTDELKGTEGGEAIDAVSTTVDQTASIVKADLSAAESIADAIGEKVQLEADAVMALDKKAAGSVDAVRAAKTSIQESKSEDSMEDLTEALTKDANDIKIDSDSAEQLAEAINKDATTDERALKVLENSSKEVNTLIDAVDDAVSKAEDSIGGDTSPSSVNEAVNDIEEEVDEVEESMNKVQNAAEDCEECNVKEISDAMKEEGTSQDATDDDTETGPEASEDIDSESKEEEDDAATDSESKEEEEEEDSEDTDIESKEEKDEASDEKEEDVEVDEKEEDVEVSSSEVDNDDKEISEPTAIASADDSERLEDVVENSVDNTVHHAYESVTDTLVASGTSSISDAGESIYSSSDVVNDLATSTTEALSEAVAVVSSLFL